ncbi:MAG: OmpA family protein [Limisphaerales bacterium]|jgi:peptidoglycan-associated lipoprotein|nr:OmpA family protein [Verrucomicrobiota bacterium]
MKSITKLVLVLGLSLAVSLLTSCKNPKTPTSSIPKLDPTISQAGTTDPLAGTRNQGTGTTRPSGPTGADRTGAYADDDAFSHGLDNVEGVDFDDTGIGQASRQSFEGRPMDTEIFKDYTIHFDFDSSAVRPSDRINVEAVADYLKAHGDCYLLIDGHCDERGTEEYNQALGERRALSAREAITKEGIQAGRVRTRSWGEARPVALGADEASYAQNRRGEFILLLPRTE